MSNQEDRKNIVESTPEYRSVMIGGPLAAPPMPRSFASMRPQQKSSPLPIPAAKPVSPAAVWEVSNLPSLPAGYFLERTNVYVDACAQDIANRVCDNLRLASIAVTIDSEDKNLLRAETNECCRFAIRLFSDSDRVIVEVQRTAGCSFQFREAARSLLKAAKGIKAAPVARTFVIPSCVPRESQEAAERRSSEGIRVALDLLASPRTDAKLLALESLDQITRSSSCRSKVAYSVLSGESLSTLIEMVQGRSESNFELDASSASTCKRRALSIVANSLAALAEEKELHMILGSAEELSAEAMVTCLVETMQDSESKPHEASHAARCLQHLLHSREVGNLLKELGAHSVISSACASGKARCLQLEQEASRLTRKLQNC